MCNPHCILSRRNMAPKESKMTNPSPTPIPTPVTGFKDSSGVFHDTYKEAIEADVIRELKLILKDEEGYMIPVERMVLKKDELLKLLLKL